MEEIKKLNSTKLPQNRRKRFSYFAVLVDFYSSPLQTNFIENNLAQFGLFPVPTFSDL